MTDRTQPDLERIITSSDILLHDAETALLYEELRAAIDDGHESMTHADALAEIAAIRAENTELRAQLEAIGAGGVQALRKCLHYIEEPLEKVLWDLLGECSPLLHQLECNDHESEEQLNSLLRRIDYARAVVRAEELPNARP